MAPGAPHRLVRPGGRRLAYDDLGERDGFPVIYCHGFPSSRREAGLIHPTARRLGVRILALDRPGCGDSDPEPRRGFADWDEDVAALTDHLGLPRFALLGISGGAPYALSCAARLPERVGGCALVCPLGPVYLDELLSVMAWPSRLLLGSARRIPWLPPLLFGRLTTGLLARRPEAVEGVRAFRAPAADLQELARPEVRDILTGAVRDAMGGGAQGALRDLWLYTHPWDIPLGAIRLPVDLWHGEGDGTVPIAQARWYDRQLPLCRARYLPGEGHYSVPLRHAEAILRALLPAPP
jgi:pimeloyl-ACP methyl ester carboxylesterase